MAKDPYAMPLRIIADGECDRCGRRTFITSVRLFHWYCLRCQSAHQRELNVILVDNQPTTSSQETTDAPHP